jgi:hypothetical protein
MYSFFDGFGFLLSKLNGLAAQPFGFGGANRKNKVIFGAPAEAAPAESTCKAF